MAFREHLFPSYAPPQINFVKGEGVWLTDEKGERYLDFISGISVNTLGHAHPDLAAALKSQADKLWHLSNMFNVPGQEELSARYCDLTFADRVFFTNSGSESVELCLKTARRYQHDIGQTQRTKIIGFQGAFHGRTYGAINAAGNPNYLHGFGPALPGYVNLDFGDHDALDREMDETCAAVIIEPVQGEGGLRPVPDQCLQGLRERCDERGILLIYDEVQCGAGRTGKLFAHQWVENAEPDLMACAKGVGGGFPMGFAMASEKVAKVMVPGTHGSTYGGGALAMAVGMAVLDHLEREEFLENVVDVAEEFRAGLESLATQKYPDMIEEVRGKGLLIGLKLKCNNMDIRTIARDDLNFLIGTAGDNVIRMAPALNVTHDEVKMALSRLDDAFAMLKARG